MNTDGKQQLPTEDTFKRYKTMYMWQGLMRVQFPSGSPFELLHRFQPGLSMDMSIYEYETGSRSVFYGDKYIKDCWH